MIDPANTRQEVIGSAERTRTLLLVDDEASILAAMKRLLRSEGYRILTAGSGAEGLEVLAGNTVDVIMSDQRMQGMSGIEFLRQVKVLYPETIRIVLSGYTELKSVTDAINEGAIYRFLTKPWNDDQLRANIQDAFNHKELADENRRLSQMVQAANEGLANANNQLRELIEGKQSLLNREGTALAVAQEILQCLPIPIIGVDALGLIIFANDAANAIVTGPPLLGTMAAERLPEPLVRQLAGGDNVAQAWTAGGRTWQASVRDMGARSLSHGRLLVLLPQGEA